MSNRMPFQRPIMSGHGLHHKIIALMTSVPNDLGLTAAYIARCLGVTKRDINRQLYSMWECGYVDCVRSTNPPKWFWTPALGTAIRNSGYRAGGAVHDWIATGEAAAADDAARGARAEAAAAAEAQAHCSAGAPGAAGACDAPDGNVIGREEAREAETDEEVEEEEEAESSDSEEEGGESNTRCASRPGLDGERVGDDDVFEDDNEESGLSDVSALSDDDEDGEDGDEAEEEEEEDDGVVEGSSASAAQPAAEQRAVPPPPPPFWVCNCAARCCNPPQDDEPRAAVRPVAPRLQLDMYADKFNEELPVTKVARWQSMNPVSVLAEYCQHTRREWVFVEQQQGPLHSPTFVAYVTVSGSRFPVERAHTKKEARVAAARRAVEIILTCISLKC
ncbi:double-stranded RNA-binding protein-putative double-stranded RNA-dependent protein kinase (PKR) inhibitor [Squirrelpox virus]|uniref:Double-stranded RNA-binding protein-putative double-stranded RNA-dependent protein kinase (PKR) inhibitor n=1 Tax=Squirrelpox virus TaxID=240426 RepID=Q1HTS7_9POXV|nr:double-stranded RNA-binding protein-putative double-stranded RNA-dependent protein kinase (PKR) inhibitor [Squirrelpox virus]ABD51459.1 H1L [Squirrelpox virus]CCD83208.1 double-stranded RNA-binding protein-putative double-stranded RNA-dependent protein kinase (PKR) inhibitor [Squirrelpox virus]